LAYQAACRTETGVVLIGSWASLVTSEQRPRRAGVVRRMASFDHWRCVSTPTCSRTAWKVTSQCQRKTNQDRIWSGDASRSVETQGLGWESALWIADQHPPDGHRRLAGMLADRRVRDGRDDATLLAVPARHVQRRPEGRRIVPDLLQGGESLASHPRTAVLARLAWGCGRKESGIQAPAREPSWRCGGWPRAPRWLPIPGPQR
jgi:hypothetical protein